MENARITLKGQEYQGNIDFKALSLIQYNLKKSFDLELSMADIFVEVDKQNMAVMLEIVIHAIQRVHDQIPREHIERQVRVGDYAILQEFIIELMAKALPNELA